MKFVSLFSGIGGLDKGLEDAGHECILQVENDPYCQRVLAKHWPDVRRIADVKEVAADDCKEADAIVGGFPCQPVSYAGARQAQADPRWLWPWFATLIDGVRPRYVVVENVPGLLSLGMGDVLGDLSALGYDAEWHRIAAATVGAPHLRWRIFIIAYARGQQHEGGSAADEGSSAEKLFAAHANSRRRDGERGAGLLDGERTAQRDDADGRDSALADAPSERRRARRTESAGVEGGSGAALGSTPLADPDGAGPQGRDERLGRPGERAAWSSGEPYTGDWSVEPRVGRVAPRVPKRVDRLRALGNAVVPQVAELVGRRLSELDARG